MWRWPHSQLLLKWPHRCDMHYHRSSCLWPRRPFPSLLSLSCQSWSQPLLNTQGQHTTPLSLSVIPFSGPTVTKINKKKKSLRIFQQSLSPSGFFYAVSSLFCEAAGLSQAAAGLFEVRTSIYRSSRQWQNTGEKKSIHKLTQIKSVWVEFAKNVNPDRGVRSHSANTFQRDIKYICNPVIFKKRVFS